MGNAHSFSAEYQDAVAIFTDGEKEQIAAIFAGIKGPEKKRFNEEDFQVNKHGFTFFDQLKTHKSSVIGIHCPCLGLLTVQ